MTIETKNINKLLLNKQFMAEEKESLGGREVEKELTRAFICIEFPDEVIKEAARVQEVLENKNFTGKMTELENLHLTYKFLGEIDEKKLEEVKGELGKIELNEFEAKLGGAGCFNLRGHPRIVWLKVGGKENFELQEKIDLAMEKCGFKKEERFMSHTTIARVKYVNDAKGFIEYVKNIGVKEIKWNVRGFVLKKSELKHSGPVYSEIERYTFRRKNIQ